jgi:hypothetical protein
VTFAWAVGKNTETVGVSRMIRERIKHLSKYKKRWVKHEDTNVDGSFSGEGEDGGGAGPLGLPNVEHGTD